MKKTFTFFLLLFTSAAFAQTDFSTIPVKTTEDCKKAEPSVIEAANLIISKPMNDASVKSANLFIITWMTNCEYSFVLDDKIGKLAKPKANENLLMIYMACEAKFLLEHVDKAKDENAIAVGAYSLLADYAANTANGVTMSKEVKKLIEAKKNDKMQEWVNAK